MLSDIEVGKEIEFLKLKIGMFLEFLFMYINKLGWKNVYIIIEDCVSYFIELDDLFFKVVIDFDEIYNCLIVVF